MRTLFIVYKSTKARYSIYRIDLRVSGQQDFSDDSLDLGKNDTGPHDQRASDAKEKRMQVTSFEWTMLCTVIDHVYVFSVY